MPELDPFILARSEADPAQMLREDLEDTLKEYMELDLIIELLQNALDAIDRRRFEAIAAAAGRDPDDAGAIGAWNEAVLAAVESDVAKYEGAAGMAEKAVLYREFADDSARRSAWWDLLAPKFGGSAADLQAAARSVRGQLRVTVKLGPPHWLEIEDNGSGMADVLECFRHRASAKRDSDQLPRRYGVRGSHGWGLTAVLGLSDRVEVASCVEGQSVQTYAFDEYASFVRRSSTQPRTHRLGGDERGDLSQVILGGQVGTHVRVKLISPIDTNELGHTLAHYSHGRFENLLRLYTPIGQINDFVLHPAYHTLRRDDIDVELVSVEQGAEPQRSAVEFDFFRLSGRTVPSHYDFASYVDAGSPRGKSVHTVHRVRFADAVLLSAADIQAAEEIHKLEELLSGEEKLPLHRDEEDREVGRIPRGFQLALSGGMRSEYLARAPRGASAAFRGVILSETARPTLGRKYVMDQRSAIPRGASSHESVYEDTRKAVLPAAEPPPATPAAAKWRREFFVQVRDALESQQPISTDLQVWAGSESREARVMLSFGELLGQGAFGDLRILRAHLRDIYDFAFLQTVELSTTSVPAVGLADTLVQQGFAAKNGNLYQRYGVGEFKAAGQDLFDDLSPDEPRKAPDTPDLLICWSFDKEVVEDGPWTVEEATKDSSEFADQTHIWQPSRGDVGRTRALAVVALQSLLDERVEAKSLGGPPAPWPDCLPDVYY
ncbi:MAG TPA: hypothetical protein VMT37_01800 [Solirubrobacterales bacterium]|nr:hypothetical protein [Solirubrobacterales bacterium]